MRPTPPRLTVTTRARRRPGPRLPLLLALLATLMSAGISLGQRAGMQPEPAFAPLDLPAPPIPFIAEDAPPPDGERVRRALQESSDSLAAAATALAAIEADVKSDLAPRLQEQVFAPVRRREAADRLGPQLRQMAEEVDRILQRIDAARRDVDAALRGMAPLAELPSVRGSVLARHLGELSAELSPASRTGATAGATPRAQVEAASAAATALRDALRSAAQRPAAADEAILREHAGNLKDALDDIGGVIKAEPDESGPWQLIDPVLIQVFFTIYSCGGKWVTIMGTAGDDKIGTSGGDPVTNGPDVINGLGGDDEIWGDHEGNNNQTGGDDTICGGPGEDRLNGWVGQDHVYGGADHDIVEGGWGDDFLDGGPGDDQVYGLGDQDVVHGGPGNDQVWGDGEGGWKDWVYGDDGDDIVSGGGGDDQVYGGAGSDFLYGNDGNDWVLGGPSDGDLWASGWSTPGVEVIGGPSAWYYKCGGPDWDYLYGGDGNDKMYGEAGQDWLDGGDGADEMHGDYVVSGGGADCMWGKDGVDTMYGENGDDVLLGGEGNDIMYGSGSNDILFGEGGDDLMGGNDGDDVVVGDYCFTGGNTFPGNDELYGGPGDDQLWGLEGDDSLNGQAGTDICDGGPGNNTDFNCETVLEPAADAGTVSPMLHGPIRRAG